MAGPARIGIDVTAALTQGGGIGRYTRELVHALVDKATAYEYRLFHARPPAASPVPEPLPAGPHIRRRPAPLTDRWLYRLWYRARVPLPVQVFTGRLDLFHSPDFVLPPVLGRIPTLLTVHDLSFVHYPETFTPALVRYLNAVVPASVHRATHVLADSRATRDDLVSLWSVPDDKITVLYSGVGPQFRPVEGEGPIRAVRARYQLGDDPYLLCVGTLQPRKNLPLLIRAFAALAAQWPYRLVIAGARGWKTDETLNQATALGVVDRVQFLGFVPDADLPALYAGATLFLFPSHNEGFGLPILEAMACGVPVLAANASSLPEVAGEAAVLLPPADERAWTEAMHRLLLDGPRRTRLVAAGFRQARAFTWHRAARELAAVYRRLLPA